MPAPDLPTALLVMPKGPGRRGARSAILRAGLRVRTAKEPYEGTALLVESPPDLVVLSLAGLGASDLGFLRTAARRAPSARVLLLVPSGRRRLAARALAIGADAALPEPFYEEEVTAVASRLVARRGAEAGSDPAPLARLAHEVAHAVNNPLQVLSLLAEEGGVPGGTARGLRSEVARVREVVGILDRFSALGPPHRRPMPLGPIVREVLAEEEAAGRVLPARREIEDGPVVPVDGAQVRGALGSLVECLAGRGESPQRVAARVRARRRAGPGAEVAVRARGVHLAPEEVEGLRRAVLWSHEVTRRAHPGLAFPDGVARAHGGALLARPSAAGTVLALALPKRA